METLKDTSNLTFSELVKSDLKRSLGHTTSLDGERKVRFKDLLYCYLFKAGFQCILLHRISHWFFQLGWIFMARFFMRLNLTLTGADIGFAAQIGPGFLTGHPVGLVIAHKTVIGCNVTVLQGVLFGVQSWHPDAMENLPIVGDYCVLCTRSMILGDIEIGNECVIGANAIVTQDIESGAFAYGSPLVVKQKEGKVKIADWCL